MTGSIYFLSFCNEACKYEICCTAHYIVPALMRALRLSQSAGYRSPTESRSFKPHKACRKAERPKAFSHYRQFHLHRDARLFLNACLLLLWDSLSARKLSISQDWILYWNFGMLNHQSSENVTDKLSCYIPGQALRNLGVSGSHISTQSAHEGGSVVSPTHRPPLAQEVFMLLISDRG